MSDESVDELLYQLIEFAPNSEQDFVELLENDDFLERLYLYLVFRIKREYQRLIHLIESNLINKKTTSIISIIEAVNQQIIELIELNSTEDNTSIVSKVDLVHKKLIELAKLLIERDIDAQNELNVVLKIEEQYLKLVELVKSNLAQSNRISIIFVIKITYGTIIEDIYRPLQGNSKSNFAATIETQYQRLIELMELNLIEKNKKVFITVIEEKYSQFLEEYNPNNESRVKLRKFLTREFSKLRASNPKPDIVFVELLENVVFLERLCLYLVKRRHTSLIRSIESNSINNKTTIIVIASILEAVNQKVIKLNSTEDNTYILSEIDLVHKKLIQLAKLLIEREIDAQNEVNFVLRIEEQYLKLVELAKLNLAESYRISVIFVIKVTYGKIIEIQDIYNALQGNSKSNFAATIETQYQRLIELMELSLIEKNSKVFISVIEEKYHQVLRDSVPITSAGPTPKIKLFYKELLRSRFTPTSKTLCEDIIITDKNINNDSHSIVKGIFLYTDGDSEIVDYMMSNFEEFDILTGEWCYIYVLEKKGINWKLLIKYWKYLLLSELHEIFQPIKLFSKKPFNRNESYKIARDFGIPSDQLPCIVFLPPLTEISGEEKLVIPIKEVSTEYFRKIFATLEGIVNQTKEQNKYEAIKVKFNDIIKYLENNSEKVIQQTTTEYQYNGTNIFVYSSNIASVTGEGKIDTAIQNQE